MNYKDKIEKALELAENLDQVEYIEEKIQSTDQINRRTKQGQELTKELLILSNKRAQKLITQGEQPFN